MSGLFARVALVSACLGLVAALGPVLGSPPQVGRASQVSTAIGIDTDPTGNDATWLGDIDLCVSVATGDSFDVDVFVADVVDLAGFQAQFSYEPSVLRVAESEVELFLATEQGRILDLSEVAPDEDGSYGFRVLDMAPGAPGHNGSGVLARLTLQAQGAGSSFLTLEQIILGDSAAGAIGDVNGDNVFDGAVGHAQVWVDEPCPSVLPTPTPRPTPTVMPAETPPSAAISTPPAATAGPADTTPATPSEGGDGGGFPWAVVTGAVIGAVVAALAVALVFRWLVRRAS